jgi:Zn finger protein HypA/HybF involved in hydrogenase expression
MEVRTSGAFIENKMKKENWSGFENFLNQTLNKVIEIDEAKAKQSYACDNCNYMWLETTYKSLEYREGYSCPKCGSKSITGN